MAQTAPIMNKFHGPNVDEQLKFGYIFLFNQKLNYKVLIFISLSNKQINWAQFQYIVHIFVELFSFPEQKFWWLLQFKFWIIQGSI